MIPATVLAVSVLIMQRITCLMNW